MSIMEYNGGAVVAMKGKNCVAIASDRRFGVQQTTMSATMSKAFKIHDKLYVGFAGLISDMQTLYERFKFRVNMYKLREERDIKPKTFAALVSSMLYEKRFGPYFVEPIIAGLDGDEPFISAMDLLGAPVTSANFAVGGTCSECLYGCAESMYKDDLGPEELFEVVSQVLLSGVDRDCLSGYGGIVHIITPTQVITRTLKGRMD
eukprot:tig00000826_g4591.t1